MRSEGFRGTEALIRQEPIVLSVEARGLRKVAQCRGTERTGEVQQKVDEVEIEVNSDSNCALSKIWTFLSPALDLGVLVDLLCTSAKHGLCLITRP